MDPIETPTPSPLLTGPVYDKLKRVVQFILPALGTLYFTLSVIWGLPSGEEVVGTIAALSLFGGVVLGISNKSYNNSDAKYDGEILLNPGEEGIELYGIDIVTEKTDWDGKTDLTLKVVKPE